MICKDLNDNIGICEIKKNNYPKYVEQKILKLIDEYSGKHFRFLLKYTNGGYKQYVSENLTKITHVKVFGKIKKRREYKDYKSAVYLYEAVLLDCEKTLNYIYENINFELAKTN